MTENTDLNERELAVQERYKRYCHAVHQAGRYKSPKSYEALGKVAEDYRAALRRLHPELGEC